MTLYVDTSAFYAAADTSDRSHERAKRIGVLRAASLDDDFAIYRFGRRRDRAFELVR